MHGLEEISIFPKTFDISSKHTSQHTDFKNHYLDRIIVECLLDQEPKDIILFAPDDIFPAPVPITIDESRVFDEGDVSYRSTGFSQPRLSSQK